MAKIVYNVSLGDGYNIMKNGTLIERAALAKRYPLVAAARPEEVIMAITRHMSLRQAETALREYVARGHQLQSSTRVPSLSEYATVVTADGTSTEEVAPVVTKEPAAERELECPYDDCDATFTSEKGRNIHMTKAHGGWPEDKAAAAAAEAEPEVEEEPEPVDELDQGYQAAMANDEPVVEDEVVIEDEEEEDDDPFVDPIEQAVGEVEADEEEDEEADLDPTPVNPEPVDLDDEDDFLRSIGIFADED